MAAPEAEVTSITKIQAILRYKMPVAFITSTTVVKTGIDIIPAISTVK